MMAMSSRLRIFLTSSLTCSYSSGWWTRHLFLFGHDSLQLLDVQRSSDRESRAHSTLDRMDGHGYRLPILLWNLHSFYVLHLRKVDQIM